ncbi:DUF5794 domain-containing protein [Halalkalirubrum salinum]|uniref:DUF5794 domain-containing protein n=1 Tax=Halalkalirubrum salinum TaxID=2563889 RepID=UPI0010FB4B3E|nr:DUF5794 domain-containing protein [Halalkalirubrum salinum]
MSVSRHPVALRLENRVGGATRLLATVMALPLIDGIFVALVLAGTLDTIFGIVETGLLIFGGSATLAVILAEMDGTRKEQVTSVLVIAALVLPLAAVEAALAPMIESVLNMEIFTRFAGLVILAIAAKTASSKVGEYLPSPGVIIALGLVASVEPNGFTVGFILDPWLIVRAVSAAGVGVLFALSIAAFAPTLRGNVDIDRFRFGSSVALGVLALPILGLLNTNAPIALAVLVVAGLFAYDPDADFEGASTDVSAATDGGDAAVAADAVDADASDEANASIDELGEQKDDREEFEEAGYGYPGEDESRAPWL